MDCWTDFIQSKLAYTEACTQISAVRAEKNISCACCGTVGWQRGGRMSCCMQARHVSCLSFYKVLF